MNWNLIEQERAALIRHATRRGAEDPEGVVQTAMLRLWLRSQQPDASFEPRAAFRYLYRSIATIVIDEHRRPYPEAAGTLPIDVERVAYHHTLVEYADLEAAMADLPEPQRIAITRRRLHGWQVDDLCRAYPALYPDHRAAYDAARCAMGALRRRLVVV